MGLAAGRARRQYPNPTPGRAQVKAASAAGAGADLDAVTEELFRQLRAGQAVDLGRLLPSPRPPPGAGPPAAALPGSLTLARVSCPGIGHGAP